MVSITKLKRVGVPYKKRTIFSLYTQQSLASNLSEKYVNPGLLSAPVFLDVVSLYKPTTPLIGSLVNVVKPSPHAEQYTSELQRHAYRKYKHTMKGRKYTQCVRELDKVMNWPQDLEFEEDRLRERFYNDHFAERLRPLNLYTEVSSSPSSTSTNESTSDVVDSVERVVAYQLKLMKQDGLSEDEAYTKACEKFYATLSERNMRNAERRAKELEEAKANSDETANIPKTAVEKWLDRETEDLERIYQAKLDKLIGNQNQLNTKIQDSSV